MISNARFSAIPFGLMKRHAILLAILILATILRLYNLLPPERGLRFAADADEGIYAVSARLALDGFVPYRDYFCSAPPLALYLFMAVLAPTSPPWGNETGFMALRLMSVIYGSVTLVAIYAIATRLGGKPAGLLATGLLAIDGWAVAQDRRAMLEAPMAMFSALAILAFIIAQQNVQHSRRWHIVAGLLAGMAILTKTQGAVVLIAIVLILILQRHWRRATLVTAVAAATYLAVSLPFLLVAADDFVRQLFFFQVLRPPNGDPALMLRVNAIRNFAESWLTVRLGLLGAAILLLRWFGVWWRRKDSERPTTAWLPVFVWAALVAASFAASRTFYLYYYAQLAAPLALLGGSLLHPWHIDRLGDNWPTVLRASSAVPRPAIAVLLIMLAVWRLPIQFQATVQGSRWMKDAYITMARYLRDAMPTGPVLAFEPNYVFLASRPLVRLDDGSFFVDSHADMIYRNLGIKNAPWGELMHRIVRRDILDEQTVLWHDPAQSAVRSALGQARYVIIDRRARYLCTDETIKTIEEKTFEIAAFGDTSLRQRAASAGRRPDERTYESTP